ncbi:MAG TPA: hypothetical protein DDW52_10550 [Planctomycetaceae bacterium]|nr:hypothetical protein [Planctomycetaceae bacterium]
MDINPYRPPVSHRLSREYAATRGALAELLRDFLDGSAREEEFAKRWRAFNDSEDEVVQFVHEFVEELAEEELEISSGVLTRDQWNVCQRLLLVLESQTVVRKEKICVMRWTQFGAAAGLVGFVSAALAIDISGQGELLALACVFGIVSIVLAKINERFVPDWNPLTPIIYPFASLKDLSSCYRTSDFRKEKFPDRLRGLRSEATDSPIMILIGYITWAMFGPLALVFQCFPYIETRLTICHGNPSEQAN